MVANLDEPARVGTLRGAGVGEIDRRRLRTVLGWVCAVGLSAAVAVLSVAGVRKNAQITSLRAHGVPALVTVSGCMGQLGGSGSNPVGYACRGAFTLGGRRYDDAIPGNADRPPGTTLHGVTLRSDPGLLSTPALVASERPSAQVFVLPALLCVLLVALTGTTLLVGRRPGPVTRPA